MGLVDVEYWAVWAVLYCALASSHGAGSPCESCEKYRARPDARVLLPCGSPAAALGPAAGGVRWTQSPGSALLEVTDAGHIRFSDPREGRVKVFPNLFREGNFSISIERLRPSDLGEYCCAVRNASVCSVVEFSPDDPALSEMNTWFIISGGAGGGSFLLLIVCFCCVKFRKRADSAPHPTGSSSPPGTDAEEIVYENDDQDPSSTPRVEIKHGPEIPSSDTRQQPPALKPYYVNQAEIDRHTGERKKRQVKTNQAEIDRCTEERKKRQVRINQEDIDRHTEERKKRHVKTNQEEADRHAGERKKRQVRTNQEEADRHAGERKKRQVRRFQYENPIYANSTEQLDQF